MALTFLGLQTEFYARGMDYLNDTGAGQTRAKRWLNDAYHSINELGDWPYLEATVSGTSPLTISDLRSVDTVVDTTNQRVLQQRSGSELQTWDANMTTQTGAPTDYYVAAGNIITPYPGNAVTLLVRYWKVAPDMSADSDTPLIPDRFRYAIVDYAVASALRDDESPDAVVAQAAGDLTVAKMRSWAGGLSPDRTIMPLVGDDC